MNEEKNGHKSWSIRRCNENEEGTRKGNRMEVTQSNRNELTNRLLKDRDSIMKTIIRHKQLIHDHNEKMMELEWDIEEHKKVMNSLIVSNKEDQRRVMEVKKKGKLQFDGDVRRKDALPEKCRTEAYMDKNVEVKRFIERLMVEREAFNNLSNKLSAHVIKGRKAMKMLVNKTNEACEANKQFKLRTNKAEKVEGNDSNLKYQAAVTVKEEAVAEDDKRFVESERMVDDSTDGNRDQNDNLLLGRNVELKSPALTIVPKNTNTNEINNNEITIFCKQSTGNKDDIFESSDIGQTEENKSDIYTIIENVTATQLRSKESKNELEKNILNLRDKSITLKIIRINGKEAIITRRLNGEAEEELEAMKSIKTALQNYQPRNEI